jgi:hypothetical protein
MTNPFGAFSKEALGAYQSALAEKEGTDFAEGDSYDFTTCIRPDGSAYGTGGTCRKGSEGKAKGRKPASRVSPKQAVSAMMGRSDARSAARLKDDDFDPDKVGHKRAAANIREAGQAAKASSPEATKKKVNKAVALIKERMNRIKEEQDKISPSDPQYAAKKARMRKQMDNLQRMRKYIAKGNAALADQAVRDKEKSGLSIYS